VTTSRGSAPLVVHLVPGPTRHGVTRHAVDLLARPAAAGHVVRRVLPTRLGDDPTGRATLALLERAVVVPAESGDERRRGRTHVHLHLTDHLLGATAGACATVVTRFAARHPLTLTLHDLPQPADGPGRFERRRAAYARMASASRGVVVASEHERTLLLTALAAEDLTPPPTHVVPLPLEPLDPNGRDVPGLPPVPDRPEGPIAPRSLVVFGYVYPGKGHRDALEALADLGPGFEDVGLTALGEVSPGHEHEVADLRARAEDLGRPVVLTGHVPDDGLVEALRRARVPVAPHRHVSASGSISSWLSAGRRPLVPAGAYVDELDARCPGALVRYGPGTGYPDLAAAARAALADPSLTWLAPGTRLAPDGDEAAARLVRIVDGWSAEAAS